MAKRNSTSNSSMPKTKTTQRVIEVDITPKEAFLTKGIRKWDVYRVTKVTRTKVVLTEVVDD